MKKLLMLLNIMLLIFFSANSYARQPSLCIKVFYVNDNTTTKFKVKNDCDDKNVQVEVWYYKNGYGDPNEEKVQDIITLKPKAEKGYAFDFSSTQRPKFVD